MDIIVNSIMVCRQGPNYAAFVERIVIVVKYDVNLDILVSIVLNIMVKLMEILLFLGGDRIQRKSGKQSLCVVGI